MQLGKAEQNSPDARRGTDEASGAWAAMLGTPPPAAQGELEPGAGGDPLGMPQPHGHEEQLAAGEERAAEPPRRAQGLSGGRGRPDRPLTGEPPSKGRQLAEGGRSAEEGAERRRRNWGLTPGPWRRPAERLPARDPGDSPPPEPLTQKWGRRERDRCGGKRLCW